jgi:WD40 repeat protein
MPYTLLYFVCLGLGQEDLSRLSCTRLPAGRSPIFDVCVSASGARLLARNSQNVVTLWKKERDKFALVSTIKCDAPPEDVGFWNNEALILLEAKKRVSICKIQDDSLVEHQAIAHEVGIEGVLDAPRARLLAEGTMIGYTSVRDTALELFDFPFRDRSPTRLLKEKGIQSLVIPSNDHSLVAVVTEEEEVIRIWDARKGVIAYETKAKGGPYRGGFFSKDKKCLILGHGANLGWQCAFTRLDIEHRKESTIVFPANKDAKAKGVVFSQDGERAYTCDNRGAIFEYSLPSKQRRLIFQSDDDFRCIAISHASGFIAVGAWSGSIVLLSIGPKQ